MNKKWSRILKTVSCIIFINILTPGLAYPFTESNTLDRCFGTAEIGECSSFVHKWYFNHTAKACQTFIWGGCGGNSLNRFDSQVECLHYCVSEDRKNQPPSKIFMILKALCFRYVTTSADNNNNEYQLYKFF